MIREENAYMHDQIFTLYKIHACIVIWFLHDISMLELHANTKE
jgi:hypothetical protein